MPWEEHDDFDELEKVDNQDDDEDDEEEDVHVLGAQMQVFDPQTEGVRLIVIATNVAETSLTIPGIISWASMASADQRAGRAGRMGAGHCYRLFSSAVFNNHFDQFSVPEIMRVPIEDVVMQMKAMGINQVNVAGSRAGSAPHLLEITDMGRLMARFPVSPRFSKMLIVAARQSQPILPYIIAIVAGLSVGDPIIRDHDMVTNQPSEDTETGSGRSGKDSEQKEERRKQRSSFSNHAGFAGASPSSDFLRILNAIGAYSAEQDHTGKSKTVALAIYPQVYGWRRPPKIQSLIRQILLTGHPDKVARLNESVVAGYGKHAVPVYQTLWGDNAKEHHLVHPSSCLQSQRPAPKWIVYNEVVGKEERMAADNSHVLQMRGSTLTLVDDTNSGEPVRRWLKGRLAQIWIWPRRSNGLLKLCLKAVLLAVWVSSETKNSTPDVFKLLGPYMATKASVVTKSWARSQTKVSRLLDDLASGNVATRKPWYEHGLPTDHSCSRLFWPGFLLNSMLQCKDTGRLFCGDSCETKIFTQP
ncbi:hypothetical protein BSLG_001683 [Batrachochytrium salamandrivorans]|nr:hypothetical protein BSLG_001683 [Batrachochytrium salamandrivorans]